MSTDKVTWAGSSVKNKIGTIIWCLASLCFLALTYFAIKANADGYEGTMALAMLALVNGVLYIAFAIGMFLGKNTCNSFVKVWGVIILIFDIVFAVALFVGVKVAGMILENMIGINPMEMFWDAVVTVLQEFPTIPVIFGLSQLLTFLSIFFVSVSDSKKSRLVALLFCIFTGLIGGHCIYAKKKPVLRIIFTVTVVLMPITFLMNIIDFFKILVGKYKDKSGEYIVDWVV